MTLLETTLIIVLVVLAINTVAVTVFICLVLSVFKQTLTKANTVIDDVHEVTNVVSSPIASVLSVVSSIKSLGNIFDHPKKGRD